MPGFSWIENIVDIILVPQKILAQANKDEQARKKTLAHALSQEDRSSTPLHRDQVTSAIHNLESRTL